VNIDATGNLFSTYVVIGADEVPEASVYTVRSAQSEVTLPDTTALIWVSLTYRRGAGWPPIVTVVPASDVGK
jgi:hypothetical protein